MKKIVKKRNIKTTAGYLRAMKKVIEAGWTKGSMARNKWGGLTDVNSPEAARFCVLGAAYRVEAENAHWNPRLRREALLKIAHLVPYGKVGIADFNDDPLTKKSDVLRLLDVAAKGAA